MSWKRIDDKRNLRNPTRGPNQRTYGWNGKMFPRLSLSIYNSLPVSKYFANTPLRRQISPSIKVGCSYKEKGGYWWEQCDIPMELLSDLKELLKDFEPV